VIGTVPPAHASEADAAVKERRAAARVLIVADAYPDAVWPAANPFLHVQAQALVRLGHEIRVFCPTPYVPPALGVVPNLRAFATLPRRARWQGIEVSRPRFPRPPGAWFRPIAGPAVERFVGPAFRREIAVFRPDIVHAHMATPMGYAAAHWSRRAGLPCIVTLHGLDLITYPHQNAHLRRQTESTLERATRVVAVSHYLAKTVRTLGITRDVDVHYVGVDIEQFRPDPAHRAALRARLGIEADAVVLCYAGRLAPEKGIGDLAPLLLGVSKDCPAVRLVVVGDGPERKSLVRAVREFGLGDRLRCVPMVGHGEMPAHLNAVDILVSPSRSEGFGQVLIEAQACGVPVIASLTGGIKEAVRDGESGILCGPGDIQELVKASRSMITSSDRRAAFGEAGRRHVAHHFELIACSRGLSSLYERVIAHQC
jgi:teichuronic acid biosynthesis glycosyltransferase TuaC